MRGGGEKFCLLRLLSPRWGGIKLSVVVYTVRVIYGECFIRNLHAYLNKRGFFLRGARDSRKKIRRGAGKCSFKCYA